MIGGARKKKKKLVTLPLLRQGRNKKGKYKAVNTCNRYNSVIVHDW